MKPQGITSPPELNEYIRGSQDLNKLSQPPETNENSKRCSMRYSRAGKRGHAQIDDFDGHMAASGERCLQSVGGAHLLLLRLSIDFD